MPNKFLTIGIALGVAALVLLLAVLMGGPRTSVQDQTDSAFNIEDVYPVPENPEDGQLQVGEVRGIVYEVSDSGILFFANRVVPKPQGVIDVIETTAQIHLAPGRELTIVADEGTVVAPDNHPREGEMRGNVVVTLYETPDGSPVDFDTDQHVVIRMYFDDPVQFDLELQQIDSAGKLFMTGPQVQFRGQGLSLNYNQLRHRIERLVIEHGESLHYIPEPKPTAKTPTQKSPPRVKPDSSAVASKSNTSPESPTAPAAGTDTSAATDPAPNTDAGGRPIQFYLATFEELDDVRVGQDQYIIEGDDLSAIFSAKSAKGNDDAQQPEDALASDASPRSEPGVTQGSIELAASDPLRGALLHALAASIGQVPEEDTRSLATFTDEDVVITWKGRLVVSPLSDPPKEIAGPDDIRVSVRGVPTKIRTENGETIDAPEVSFFSQNSRLLAKGTPDSPVHVSAPDMGKLLGQELSIDQLNANGYVLGPGQLTGQIKQDPEDSAATSSDTTNPTAESRPISVAFDNRLDLDFYLKDKDASAAPEPDNPMSGGDSRIKGVKSAAFTGNVRVDYTDLDMTADSLTLAMLEDAPEGDDKLAVSSLDAQGNIKADVVDQDVMIEAHRLHAEPARDQLELFGKQGAPALVIRPDATLAGDHIVMDQQARTVTVMGPGWFDVMQDPDDPGKTVRVTWATRMDYDDAEGTAKFLGDVRTLSTDGTDTNELMGDQLDMVFVKDDSANDESADSNSRRDRTAGRRLATAHMTGTVRFRARSYATPNHQQLLTELFMLGPEMLFTDPAADGSNNNAPQQVQIIGTGRMLITDTRPKSDLEASITPASNSGQPSIDIAGRGKTAFQWSDRLVLNLTAGIMTMKGSVVMVHDPEDGDRVQLDCTDLAAELKQTDESRSAGAKKTGGGGGGWLDKDAPKPELERVWADGGIRILQGPTTVYCDHLLYEESKREMLIWSDDPRTVTVEVEGEPNLTKASAFKWNRDTNRREAFKIRSGTIPIRRSERE